MLKRTYYCRERMNSQRYDSPGVLRSCAALPWNARAAAHGKALVDEEEVHKTFWQTTTQSAQTPPQSKKHTKKSMRPNTIDSKLPDRRRCKHIETSSRTHLVRDSDGGFCSIQRVFFTTKLRLQDLIIRVRICQEHWLLIWVRFFATPCELNDFLEQGPQVSKVLHLEKQQHSTHGWSDNCCYVNVNCCSVGQ